MLRVMKVEEEDLLQGEVPVQLDEENFRMSYQVITDPKFPGQFRIVRVCVCSYVCDLRMCVCLFFYTEINVHTLIHTFHHSQQGKQIEKICAMTNWDYYEAVER